MTKLKTLKDLKGDYAVRRNELKKEAIKWVKEDLKLCGDATISLSERMRIIMNKWMERFNITEEELK